MKYLRKLDIRLTRGVFKNPIKGSVRNPEQLYRVFRGIKDEAKETLLGVYLSDDLELWCYEVITVGSQSATLFPPDEIFRSAILTNSRYIILIHNHPSGKAEPSTEDHEMMALLSRQAPIMRRRFLDFIIVGARSYWSMFEELDGGEYNLGVAV